MIEIRFEGYIVKKEQERIGMLFLNNEPYISIDYDIAMYVTQYSVSILYPNKLYADISIAVYTKNTTDIDQIGFLTRKALDWLGLAEKNPESLSIYMN